MRLLRWAVVPAIVIPVVWVSLVGISRDPRELPSPLVGRPMPEFSLVAMDGRAVTAESLRGRPALINFWASYCVPCRAEHEVLTAAQEAHGDQLAIVGVLYEDRVEDARAFLARYGDAGWPNLLDPGGRLAIEFGVTGPPESFLIDADGIVRYKQFGPVTEEVLEQQLPPLLARRTESGS